MARTVATLLLLAALAVAAHAQASAQAAQTCVRIGGPLLAKCSKELDYVKTKYKLDADFVPTDAQVQEWLSTIPKGLPTATCCDSAKEFDSNACACQDALPNLLKQVGVTTSKPGLEGVVKITGVGCKFPTKPCA